MSWERSSLALQAGVAGKGIQGGSPKRLDQGAAELARRSEREVSPGWFHPDSTFMSCMQSTGHILGDPPWSKESVFGTELEQ